MISQAKKNESSHAVGSGTLIEFLQGRSAGNNFNELAGDDGLASTVESQGQLANHFT